VKRGNYPTPRIKGRGVEKIKKKRGRGKTRRKPWRAASLKTWERGTENVKAGNSKGELLRKKKKNWKGRREGVKRSGLSTAGVLLLTPQI